MRKNRLNKFIENYKVPRLNQDVIDILGGSGWGGRREGGSGWGRHVNPRPFHFNV